MGYDMSEWQAEAAVWRRIADAARLIATGTATWIDGKGWKVYRAGKIIRVDLSEAFNPAAP
jgi:hypothetical protein